MTFYCTSPSCSYPAEEGSEKCDFHNGRAVHWFTVLQPNGRKLNIRTTREDAEARGEVQS